MVKLYMKEGWKVDRIRGSHYIMINEQNPLSTIPIPVHRNQSLKKGLERSLLKVLENKK